MNSELIQEIRDTFGPQALEPVKQEPIPTRTIPRVYSLTGNGSMRRVRINCSCGNDRVLELFSDDVHVRCGKCRLVFTADELDYGVSAKLTGSILERARIAAHILTHDHIGRVCIAPIQTPLPHSEAPLAATDGGTSRMEASDGAPPPSVGGAIDPTPPGRFMPPPNTPGREFFSCRCARIKRLAPSIDLCPECKQPLCLEWNGDPYSAQPLSAEVWLERFTDLAVRNLSSIRSWINEHRDELRLSVVMRCLEEIDEARRISLHGLADTPVVMPRHITPGESPGANCRGAR